MDGDGMVTDTTKNYLAAFLIVYAQSTSIFLR